jgi:hypothetical protein
MEQICTPTRRYQDSIGHNPDLHDDHGNFFHTEVQLAMPVEDFLAYRWDWVDLEAFLVGGTESIMLWITEHAFLVVEGSWYPEKFEDHDYIAADIQPLSMLGDRDRVLTLVRPYQSDKLTAELGVFWRAVAGSNSVQLKIKALTYMV